ncbi:YihY/virulence factor BrkB family protein [Mesobacillus harenae]|uniref:YihY/virulence factor BrkB family protein n=1 Tax=Mesobacillus harenae TaxID=2213203 RepID=UPI0015806826|nr:YihY/virulence factor BrkB family protein [Mesobacillus harenae]
MVDLSFFRHIWQRIQTDDIPALAAQLAYFFLLSLFPLLLFLFTLVAYLPISEADLLQIIRDYAPGETMAFIENSLSDIMKSGGKVLSFGFVATLWSASNGMNAVIIAFNKAYRVKETRSFIVARGMSVVMTVAMIFVFIIALLLPVFGREIGLFLFSHFGLSDEFLKTWNTLRWLISVIILFIVFTGLYWITPNKKLTCTSALPGAIFATIGWILSSLAFSYYVSNFAHFTDTYGSIGVIIVLMLWLYISGFIIIVGGTINAYFSDKNRRC